MSTDEHDEMLLAALERSANAAEASVLGQVQLRDWFAGLAMAAQVEAMDGLEGQPLEDWALFSYEMADWMLNARDVKTGAARERKP